MKFGLNISKIYIFLILTAFAVLDNLNAQQYSILKDNHFYSLNRYTFPDFLQISKTYSISQNNLGVLFFTTDKGIITFNGQDWGIIYFNEEAYLTKSSDKLYLFSNNYTGEIYREQDGTYALKEIKINYPEKSWKITDAESAGDMICLIANQKIWSFKNNSFQSLKENVSEGYLFSNGKTIFLDNGANVSDLLQGKYSPVLSPLNKFKKARYLNGGAFFPIYSKNKQLFLSHQVDKLYLEVSIPVNDEIVCTFPDVNNKIWALSSSALYSVKSLYYFDYLSNIPSLLNPQTSVAEDSTGIYLADNQNIYHVNFSKLKLESETIKQIQSLENKILVSTSLGIYQIKNNQLDNIVLRPISYAGKFQDKLLFISKNILFSLRFNYNSLSVKELFNLKTGPVKKIIGKDNGDLVLLDNYNDIYLLKIQNNGFICETLLKSSRSKRSPKLENIFLINENIYVNNTFEIFKLEGNKLKTNAIPYIDFPSQGQFIDFLEEDSSGGILLSASRPRENKRIFYGKKNSNLSFTWYEIPIWEANLKNPFILSNNGKDVLLFENENLVNFNLTRFFNQTEKVIISNQTIIVDKNILYSEYRKKGNESVPYFETRYPVSLISLKFQAIDLTSPEHIQYSYLLEKNEVEWSPWAYSPEKNFSNLPPGEYKLLVKAKTINGCISDPYSIRFRILPPFYLQWYAWMIYIFLFVGVIGLLGFRRKKQFEQEKITLERIIQERTAELTREKEKTDELLANMLPKDTAEELKNTGKATSQKFDMVTVLFSDIQGFTKIAEQMNPEKLIDELDNFFFQFDSVVEKYNIEKIKTIGDAYMAAGGIPYKNRTNPVEVVLAAIEMQEYMKTLKIKNSDIWDLRIGVHTGAVIAGVVGHKRISYDIWGDTVNTASRMESSGEASKVNISGHTYELIKEFFICEYRGKMPVKYKGDIDMYFVKGIRPELSVNLRSIPNKKFFIQLQLLRILDLEEFIFNKLEAELPTQYVYHNLKHTKDVYTQVELIGRAENITMEEMLLLRTAALLHDLGFIATYQNPELKSIEACREILPRFKYSGEQIIAICNLILCTRKNTLANNKLEEILIDANNDYLGRIDYMSVILNLYHETKIYNNNKTEEDWLLEQIKILETHEFYSDIARKLREVPKKEQIDKIKEHLKQYV